MSKDVVIAGAIVAACLGLVGVAFWLPKKEKTAPVVEPTTTFATTDSSGATPGLPGDNTSLSTGFDTISAPNANGFGTTGTSGFGTAPTTGFGTVPTQPVTSAPTTGFAPTPAPLNSGVGSPKGFGTLPAPAPVTMAPAPVEPVAAAGGEKSHVVAKGETLGDISMKYYGTSKHWKKIAEANQVDSANLQVGASLSIPEVAGATAATTSETSTSSDRSYKIKSGDTYYSIAKRELGSAARWKEIEKLNKLQPEDVRVGMTIKLPASAKASKEAKESTAGGTTDHAGSGRTHTVVAGETLGDISKKSYGTTKHWKKIAEANPGVDAEALKVGQKLNLPEIAGTTPSASSDESAAMAVGGADYVVKAGDTLELIAQNQLGKKSDAKKILEANPGLDPRRLRIGQKIVIPGGKASAPESAPEPMPAPSFPSNSAPVNLQPINTPLPALPPSTSGFGPQSGGMPNDAAPWPPITNTAP